MTFPEFNPAAIIVTFYPDSAALARLVALLTPQVEKIYIVDNTPSGLTSPNETERKSGVTITYLGKNLGVAAAHNRGIEQARSEGFTHVLLMDQDSVPPDNMVRVLFRYLSELEREGLKIGAVGPQIIDVRTGKARGFVTTRSGRFIRITSERVGWIRSDYLATSGSLIPMAALDAVGLMEEALFIDGVDIEWGYRATLNGFASVGIFEARMNLARGEGVLSLPGFQQNLYAPSRHYYSFRNFCTLARRRYVSSAWKRHILWTSPLYALMLATLIGPRLENAKMITRGLAHGLRQKTGRIL